MQLLSEFVWDRGFWQNVVVTIAAGGPLSVYLALVVNRLAEFRQIKFAAIIEVSQLMATTLKTENAMQAQIALGSILEMPLMAFREEGQIGAMRELNLIRRNLLDQLKREILNESHKRGIGSHYDLKGNEWIAAQSDIYQRNKFVLREAFKRVQRLPMDFGTVVLLGFRTALPIVRSDCDGKCKNCNRTI